MHRGSRIGAVMHRVVDEACVPLDRDTVQGGIEISFRCSRILEIAQIVAGIGEEFDERNAEVGGRRSVQSRLRALIKSRSIRLKL